MTARLSLGGAVKPALDDHFEVALHVSELPKGAPQRDYLANRLVAEKMPTAVLGEVEPVFCRARLPHATALGGFVTCYLDHAETGEVKHAAHLNGSDFRWSDEDMRIAATWKCLSCGEPCPTKGMGGCCSRRCWQEAAA